MARWKERSKILERELANTRRSIHASAFRRAIPTWAKRLGLDVNQLIEVAERSFCLCATCLGPIKTPRPYHVNGQLRGVLCAACGNAVDKTGGDLVALSRTKRFGKQTRVTRVRVGRLVALHAEDAPPATEHAAPASPSG